MQDGFHNKLNESLKIHFLKNIIFIFLKLHFFVALVGEVDSGNYKLCNKLCSFSALDNFAYSPMKCKMNHLEHNF